MIDRKRVTIIAKGDVQRVGYRDVVERIARKLKITGFVENLKPYEVRIVAEGEDERIDQFIERIKIKKFPIDVEDLELSFDDFKGEFDYFEIKRGDWHEEIGERLDVAGTLLYRTVELGEKSVEVSERSVEVSERSVEVSEESVNIGKKMLEKQDETIEEIRSLRGDLKSYMEERFEQVERDIKEIKAKIGMF